MTVATEHPEARREPPRQRRARYRAGSVGPVLIGLTGGIGAGKSAVAALLADHGAVLIEADVLAREVVAPGTAGLARVVDEFGPGVLTGTGELDRAALASIVFTDDAARARLEAIIHPLVRERAAALRAGLAPDEVVVHDVPLLVEAGLAGDYDLVLVVEAPEPVRVRRLTERRGMTEDEARARIAAQASDSRRREVADAVIVNDGTVADLAERVEVFWRDHVAGR